MAQAPAANFPEAAWLEEWLAHLAGERRLSPHTLRNYRQGVTEFFTFVRGEGRFGGATDAVPELLVRSFLIEMQRRGISRRTLHLHVSACRGFFRYLGAQGRTRRNPFTGVALPKLDKPLPKFLTEKQMQRFLEGPRRACENGALSPFEADRDLAIFELLYGAGFRISELVGLRVRDLDMASGMARVLGKGKKERLCPVGPAAVELVRRLRREHGVAAGPADPVLPGAGGRPLTVRWVQRRMKYYLQMAELPADLTPHKIRHAFATHMINAGADLRVVQEMLGHASLSTTQIYTHVSLQRLKDAHRKAHPRA